MSCRSRWPGRDIVAMALIGVVIHALGVFSVARPAAFLVI